MSVTVAIIGAGQLGRRYLEGLALSGDSYQVWVVDPNVNSLEACWVIVQGHNSDIALTCAISPEGLPKHLDLLISATTADVRVTTVKHALEISSIRFMILEKVLSQSIRESRELFQLSQHTSGVWVNYARRAMAWHNELRRRISANVPLQASVRGVSWGLMTNGLHFIDLLEWWTGSRALEVSVVPPGTLTWYESKRRGFLDAYGAVSVGFEDGSELVLESWPQSSGIRRQELVIRGDRGTLTLDESDGRAFGSMIGEPIGGRLELQSQLTGSLVRTITKAGVCPLPELHEVVNTHELFIDAIVSLRNDCFEISDRVGIT